MLTPTGKPSCSSQTWLRGLATHLGSISLGALALLLLLLALGGCSNEGQALEAGNDEKSEETSKKKDSENGEKKEEELPPVEVVSLELGSIEAVLRFSTNLEAESEVQVFSQAARQVTSLRVEEGDQVRKGQVLVRLQDEEQRSELARIESQLEKARREYRRQENLFAQQLISEQLMNDATYEVDQLELALGDAQRSLGYTEVLAPISGTITGRNINLGDHIMVNQHLFDMVDFDTIVARVYVPEKELERLSVGLPARLYSASIDGGARVGEVIRVAPIVDPKSGTVKVTVGIPRNQALLPGMYVEVELVTDTREDALLVPKRAVIYDQNEAFLYRLKDDMTAERLRVSVLLEDRENIMPGPDSVSVGDRIVVSGQAGLKDGAKVRLAGRPRQGEEPAPSPEEAEPTTGEPAAGEETAKIEVEDRVVQEDATPCLSFREAPAVESVALECLPPGTRVRWLEAAGDWSRVALSDGREGWLADAFLAPPAGGGHDAVEGETS